MAWTDWVNGDILPAWYLNLLANQPAGMVNGKLVITAPSNTLKLEIKTRAGTDPSSTDPVFVTIGGVRRAITAALSVTVPAAVNTFNAGSAELATKEIDLFPYLGWRVASSTVFVAMSRIPWGGVYSQFHATATNEKYLAYSGSAPASTDEVANVGRFAATLSAGAGYTWTIPTYNADNLKQFPVYETRRLAYTPVGSASSGTITTMGACSGFYQVLAGSNLRFEHTLTITTNGTGAGYFKASLPFTCINSNSHATGIDIATNKTINGLRNITDNIVYWKYYDATYPGADGRIITGSMTIPII